MTDSPAMENESKDALSSALRAVAIGGAAGLGLMCSAWRLGPGLRPVWLSLLISGLPFMASALLGAFLATRLRWLVGLASAQIANLGYWLCRGAYWHVTLPSEAEYMKQLHSGDGVSGLLALAKAFNEDGLPYAPHWSDIAAQWLSFSLLALVAGIIGIGVALLLGRSAGLRARACAALRGKSKNLKLLLVFVLAVLLMAAGWATCRALLPPSRDGLVPKVVLEMRLVDESHDPRYDLVVPLGPRSSLPTPREAVKLADDEVIKITIDRGLLEETFYVHSKPDLEISNTDITKAWIDMGDTGLMVRARLTREGDRKLRDFTRQHVGHRVVIMVEGKPIIAPLIAEEIGEEIRVLGPEGTREEAERLVKSLLGE